MTQVFDRRRVPIRRVRLEVGTLGLVRNTAGHRTQTKLVCLEHQRSISPLPPPPPKRPRARDCSGAPDPLADMEGTVLATASGADDPAQPCGV